MGQAVGQAAARREKELGKARIVIPPEERKERARKARERRGRAKERMSSKSRKRDSKGGLRDDPSEGAKKSGEEAALS